MPAIIDDPSGPLIHPTITTGSELAPSTAGPSITLPLEKLDNRQVHLRDRVTPATIYPILDPLLVPLSLVSYLCDEFNLEIERGDTYPLEDPMSLEKFQNYWFGNFGAIMLTGTDENIQDGRDWSTECLGTFYTKPNYIGRSSHICNAGFLVCTGARGKGVGRLLGEAYLDYAPKLGYTYSVFNLVYETNLASVRIWDSLGFKRIGRVKGAGRLKGHEEKVDALIYGRDLGDDDEYVSDERFDKIRYYLEKGKYPPGANRSEKSRLRSAATHYRLDGDRLMLKDKEVVSDPQKQYEIARGIHVTNHGGINKTTASIAEKYHWVQIKKTVSQVIKNCLHCKEQTKAPVVRAEKPLGSSSQQSRLGHDGAQNMLGAHQPDGLQQPQHHQQQPQPQHLQHHPQHPQPQHQDHHQHPQQQSPQDPHQPLQAQLDFQQQATQHGDDDDPHSIQMQVDSIVGVPGSMSLDNLDVSSIPVDPGLTMEDVQGHQQAYSSQDAASMMHPMHELNEVLDPALGGHGPLHAQDPQHHLHHHHSPHDPQHSHLHHPDDDMVMDDVRQRNSASATAAAAVAALSEGERRGLADPSDFQRIVDEFKGFPEHPHGVDGLE